jgi:hypothetical protein
MGAACSSKTSVTFQSEYVASLPRRLDHEKLKSYNCLACQKDKDFDMPSTEKEVSSSDCPYVQDLYPETDFEMVVRNGVLFFCPKARNISV